MKEIDSWLSECGTLFINYEYSKNKYCTIIVWSWFNTPSSDFRFYGD